MTPRRARAQDLPLLLTLVAEFCALDQHPFDSDRVAFSLSPLLDNDEHGVVYIVEPDTGYLIVTWGYSLESGGREGLIDEIYLRRRGEGIGASVMTWLFEEMRRRGIVRMFLETESHNDRARHFYAQHDFEADDSIWMSRTL